MAFVGYVFAFCSGFLIGFVIAVWFLTDPIEDEE